MRTKLDEIVEEEGKSGGWHVQKEPEAPANLLRPTMDRIAERAFRHGVERGVATAPYMKDGRSYIVQPAPAEEKPIPAPDCPARCGGPHSLRASDGIYHCNTRKGQRRKAPTEVRWDPMQGEVWIGKGYRDFGQNIRSGKDRRKS